MMMLGKDILTQLMMEMGVSQCASNKLHPIKIPSHDDDDAWEGYPHSACISPLFSWKTEQRCPTNRLTGHHRIVAAVNSAINTLVVMATIALT